MTFTEDELLFLELIHSENFEKDMAEWIDHMEETYS